MRKKVVFYLSLITILTANILLLWFIFSLFVPLTNLQISDFKYPKRIDRGDSFNMSFNLCKKTPISVNLVVELTNGETIPLATKMSTVGKGCHHVFITNNIPKNAPTANYVLKVTVIQNINFLRTNIVSKTIEDIDIR